MRPGLRCSNAKTAEDAFRGGGGGNVGNMLLLFRLLLLPALRTQIQNH